MNIIIVCVCNWFKDDICIGDFVVVIQAVLVHFSCSIVIVVI